MLKTINFVASGAVFAEFLALAARLGAARSLVRPLFPSFFYQALIALLLTSGCAERDAMAPLPAEAVVLAFGDSITAGLGATPETAYPARLAAATGWQLVNAGVSGDTARAASKRLAPLLARHQPVLVILELGGNDFLRQFPVAQVRADLQAMISEIRATGAVVALVAVPRLSLLRVSIGALSDSPIYDELAAEEGVILVPSVLSDVLSDETLRADEIHPNARGHAQISAAILTALTEVGLFGEG